MVNGEWLLKIYSTTSKKGNYKKKATTRDCPYYLE